MQAFSPEPVPLVFGLGLRVTPGPPFTVHGTGDRFLRLPFTLPAERFGEVAALLRQAAERTAAGLAPSQPAARWTA